MIRVVIDPGVLVAAALTPQGLCGQLVQAVQDERSHLIACPALMAELGEVLLQPKFRRYLTVEQAERQVDLIAGISEQQPDPVVSSALTPDPDDDYLVALALAPEADYLISGDADLTGLPASTARVVTPTAFALFLEQAGYSGLRESRP